MRVLTFLHSFEPGGVERVALRLVAHWRRSGVEAPLFLGREDGSLREELAADLEYEVPRQPPTGSGWFETIWMIARLPGAVRRHRPDLLFCAGSTYTVVAVAMKLLLGRRCPPIVAKISNDVARHDLPFPLRRAWYAWLRLQARFIDHWIVMEPAMAEEVVRTLGPVAHSVICDPAVSAAQLDQVRLRLPRGERGRRFVAIGRLVAQKDYPRMLRAFADGAVSGDTLKILGDGPLRARLERLARDLGIGDRVRFAGHVPNASARLGDYDVFLLSSAYEGLPAVLVEALAVGLTIVATDCGVGVRALLGEGRFGTLVGTAGGASLAAAIGLARPGNVDIFAAREQARRFTIERAAAQYLDLFARMAIRARMGSPALPPNAAAAPVVRVIS